jgi:hypothetical protein
MTPSESDPQTDILRSIASSLKSIQSSLDQLTAAVEGVAESIEKAHEPEGDLGVHLVGALKDLSSAMHKRAVQERLPAPQIRQQQQPRREDRHQYRQDPRAAPAPPPHGSDFQHHTEHPQGGESPNEEGIQVSQGNSTDGESSYTAEASQEQPQDSRPKKLRPNNRRRGKRGSKPQGSPEPPPSTAS